MSYRPEDMKNGELKDKITNFTCDIPKPVVKIGCITIFLVGFFFFILTANLLLFGGLTPQGALKLTIIEIVILFLVYLVFYIIYKLLGPFTAKIGHLYYSDHVDKKPKPEVFKAQMFQKKGEYKEAIREYRKLLSKFPERIDFLYEIAEIYRNNLKDKDKALGIYREVIKYPNPGGYAYIILHSKEIIKELEDHTNKRADIIEIDGRYKGDW